MRVVAGYMILMIALLDAPPAHGDEPPSWLHTWGTSGSGDGQFNAPQGIAIDSAGFVYVSERLNHRIQRFTAGGVFTVKWGVQGTGDGQFKNPHGVAIGPDGTVYVADTGNHRVQKFTQLGTFILKWGSSGTGTGQFSSPAELEVDRNGNVLVADRGNRRIQKFTGEGVFLTAWGSAGSGNGQFQNPYGIAVDHNDFVYVTDGSDIQKFTSDGVYVLQWGAAGGADGWFRGAAGIAISPDDKVYVTDTGNHRVQKFTNTGDFLTKWGEGGMTNGNFYSPAGIAVNDRDQAYVVDSFLNRVQIFSPLPDTVPPSSVADLHVTGWSETSVTLGWSAPGDDDVLGRSAAYDVRYSTSPITEENFAAADPATGEPMPQIVGSQQSFEVGGLQFGVFYYFALRSSDDAGNESGLSNVTATTTRDVTPPGAVTDLSVTGVSTQSAGLAWTAPGDNGSIGTAASYDVRYSTQPITESTFATRPQASGEPIPGPAGTPQTMDVTGLNQGTQYYFALKTQDEVPNVSAISNVPGAVTLDEIPPSSVTDLHVTAWTETTLTLGWSAPGDDGTVGRATAYDIRYSTSPITGENFAAAEAATGEPAPKIAGSQESFEIGGLGVGVFYYFALRSSDEAGNTSGLSNVTTTTSDDLAPPGAVTNLSITGVSSQTVGLAWTAPGDNGFIGTAASYDVRYSTQPISESSFATRSPASGEPTPGPAGTPQTMYVTGLNPGTRYYFALKTLDEVPNLSAISNVPNATTLAVPATNQDARILLHVAAPVTKNTCAPGFIPCADAVTSAPAGGTAFAYVLVGDASPTAGVGGVQFGVLYDGVIAQGVDVFAWSSCGSGGALDTGWPGSGTGNVVFWEADSNCQRGVPGAGGTSVVAVAGYFYLGTYSADVLRLTPRPATGTAAVVDCDGSEAVIQGGGVNPVPSQLGFATFSYNGTPGYNPCIPAPTGVPEESPKVSRLSAAPNPFSSRTMILFQMTTPAVVELTVFDAAGRRVRELIDEPRGSGDHAVAWDGRDDRGVRLPRGVYFARLNLDGESAGAYRIVLTRS